MKCCLSHPKPDRQLKWEVAKETEIPQSHQPKAPSDVEKNDTHLFVCFIAAAGAAVQKILLSARFLHWKSCNAITIGMASCADHF